jgi:uracil-DNA glycosylase family 4
VIPAEPTIPGLRAAAEACTACSLYKSATQTVFGEGPELIEAGIDRARIYVTNAVKHFKWVPRGPRRIHGKPGAVEIEACRPWLEAEIAAVWPRIIVALGATAAQAVFGRAVRVTRDRGRPVPSALAPHAFVTVHPSALLRAPDEATRRREILRFIEDLRKVGSLLT